MSNFEEDKNSKVVFLRRNPLSIPESSGQGNPELKNYFDQANRPLGPYWSKSSTRPGTGLTLIEENFLMEIILEIPTTDRDFRQKVTQFFHDISTEVKPTALDGTGGTRLEIGLQNNKEQVSPTNLPLQPMDYIRYRHAMSHPRVVKNKEEADGNSLAWFYIHDPKVVAELNKTNNSSEDDALAVYLKIKNDDNSVKEYLSLLGGELYKYKGEEVFELKRRLLKNPTAFLKIHKDPDRSARFLLKQLWDYKIVEIVGSRYIVGETREQLGSNIKEAISYIKDAAKSKEVVLLQAKLQEAVSLRK